MSRQDRYPAFAAAPDGRGGGGGDSADAGSAGWDEPADQFAGGMARIPRRDPAAPRAVPAASRPEEEGVSPRPGAPDAAHAGAAAHPHDPPHGVSRRRRRPRRHRKKRRLGPVLAIAGVVAVIGALIGVGGGFGMVWVMRDSPLASIVSPEEEAARAEFISACAETLTSIDCGCLWEDARPAFTPQYRSAVLRLIDERRDLPVRLQRIRSEKLLGPELAKTVWDAAFYCADR